MRGDQQSRQWRVIRAIDASPNGLTVTGITKPEETGIRTTCRDLEAIQAKGFPPYTKRVERSNRSAFKDLFKFQFSQKLMKLNWQREAPRPVRS